MMTRFRKFSKTALMVACLLFFNRAIAAERPKIGLVLSGGGAMGFAHIGVLKMLDSLQIPVDYIAGTSMGGIAGALYAIGYTGREIEQIANSVDWQRTFTDRAPREMLPYFQKQDAEKYQFELGIKDFLPLGPGGVIVGQNIMLLLSRLVFDYADVNDFDSLQIPFRCVAVDLITGNEVVLGEGSLAKAMRATMAVPSIFSPVEWGDSLLVDGGLLNNLPVDVARGMGAGVVIASIVGNPNKEVQEIRSTIDVLTQSFNILRDKTMKRNMEDADVLIDTKLIGLGAADFDNRKIVRIIAAGEQAAKAAEPEIIALRDRYQLRSNRFYRQSQPPDSAVQIGEIQFIGNRIIPEVALREIVRLRKGDRFHPDTVATYLEKLRATGDFYYVRYLTETVDSHEVVLKILLEEKKRPIIYGVTINGNETLPFDFIYRLLGIKPGEIFIHSQIEDRITYLYSLGYFEKIYYEIESVGENSIRFNLFVKESPEVKIRLGLRYDNYYQLIAALNFLVMNKPVPGIRIENEIQFIGREKLSTLAYYPSRTLDYPLYPFVNLDYEDIDLFIYDVWGNKSATYKNRYVQAGFGLGLLYKNYWNVEAAWNYEWAHFRPVVAVQDPVQFPTWRDEFWKMRLSTNVDRLDDTFVPRKGLLLHAHYGRSLQDPDTYSDYVRMDVSLDYYKTCFRKHTFHLYGYYGWVDMDSLTNKFLVQGGPADCIGVEYNQLLATGLSALRLDYRYELRRNLYLSLIGNIMIHYRNDIFLPGRQGQYIPGYGVGLKYLTALGLFEIILSRGEKSAYQTGDKQTVLYFNAGYKF
ncbi:MAG: patatin-like phospholipase family protein [Fidelibacterota bacterium]